LKTIFQRLHRTAWVAFTVMTVLMLLCLTMFGHWPAIMVLMWVISLSLMVMVLIGCIFKNVYGHFQRGEYGKILLRYLISCLAVFGLLTCLDMTVGEIAWLGNTQAALIFGCLGLYARP